VPWKKFSDLMSNVRLFLDSTGHVRCLRSYRPRRAAHGEKIFFYRIRWPRSNISPSFKISMLFNVTLSCITLSIHQASFEFVKLKLLMFKAKSYKITDVRCGDKFGGLKQRERATCIAHRYVCSLSIIIGYIIYYWLHHSLLATRSQSSASLFLCEKMGAVLVITVLPIAKLFNVALFVESC